MPNDNLTEIACIVDRSGSMSTIRDDAIGGFNQFLEEQKVVPGEANVTRVIFDDQYEIIDNNVPIKDVAPFTTDTYVPRGWTALLDAIGKTINTIRERIANTPEEEKPSKVMVAILTDGEENCSTEFKTKKEIFDLIKECKESGNWEFLYLGANQDAIREGQNYGISAKMSMNFAASASGVRGAYKSMSDTATKYRTQKLS